MNPTSIAAVVHEAFRGYALTIGEETKLDWPDPRTQNTLTKRGEDSTEDAMAEGSAYFGNGALS